MEANFDQFLYDKLLSEGTPETIQTEADYDRLLLVCEKLHLNKNLTSEERALYRKLVSLIKEYEEHQVI